MRFRLFKKRFLAALTDFIIIFVIAYTVCAILITTVFKGTVDQQAAPFEAITLLLNPLYVIVKAVIDPFSANAYGVFLMLGVAFVIEVLYYSFFELLPGKRTPGYALAKLRLCYDTDNLKAARIILRNILKVMSRYLYYVPFLVSVFSANGNTIYDIVSKISVEISEPSL